MVPHSLSDFCRGLKAEEGRMEIESLVAQTVLLVQLVTQTIVYVYFNTVCLFFNNLGAIVDGQSHGKARRSACCRK